MAEVFYSDGRLYLRGDLTLENESELNGLAEMSFFILELGEMEVTDGVALSALVRWIKTQLQLRKTFQLVEPPQVLIHNLYRVNCYPHAGLMVVDMRQDEPYS